MVDLLCLVIAVEVPRRLRECRVGAAADDDAVLLFGHGLEMAAGFGTELLADHATGDGHHDVDDEGAVTHLQIGERPPLVEHAQADFAALPRAAIVDTSSSSSSVGM